MSYPYGLTLHAGCTGSLRYGRTTLRLRPASRTPAIETVRIRRDTQRNLRPLAAVGFGMVSAVPLPRRPLALARALDTGDTTSGLTGAAAGDVPSDVLGHVSSEVRRWYENELGWATVPGPVSAGLSPRLVTGLRFDVLDVPAEAGFAALRHRGQTRAPRSPVALSGDRMLLLVAAGSADELPGLLDWLEWGRLTPDLRAIGAGGDIEAPLPPGRPGQPGPPVAAGDFPGRTNPQGAALWLRPPETGRGTEIPLPTMSALGGVGGAPDLVRLVDTLATQCHRIRLRRACAQPLAFS
jgi:hypothetical protein